MKPIVVGVSGGSGSGKTTLAEGLRKSLGEKDSALIYQDSYYLDHSRRFDFDGGSVNFDHPDSLEFSLLARHLAALKQLQGVDIPLYDFKTHSRMSEICRLEPRRVILVDGILILSQPEIVRELDFSIFVDTPEDLRFSRRLCRDVSERGRTEEGVRAQFARQVKPMHDLFVEPSKQHAKMIVSGAEEIKGLIERVIKALKPIL